MLRKQHRVLKRVLWSPGTIGYLEKRAGITDRKAFWMPYAKFSDGFQRCVKALNLLAEARETETAANAGWSFDKKGYWHHPEREGEFYATAYDVVVLNDLVHADGVNQQ